MLAVSVTECDPSPDPAGCCFGGWVYGGPGVGG